MSLALLLSSVRHRDVVENEALLAMINKPIPLEALKFTLYLRSINGSERVTANLAVLEEYNADPDAFAARHFGVTVEDYTTWIEQNGTARCGATTSKGRPCKSGVGAGMLGLKEFLEIDRTRYCKTHGGE